MAVDRYERILDPLARIPGQVYVCPMHFGLKENPGPDGNYFRSLPDDELCKNCVRYEDLCPEWITTLGTGERHASVRCLLSKNHDLGHLCDDVNGRRFSWVNDAPTAVIVDSFDRADGNLGSGSGTWTMSSSKPKAPGT